MSSEAIALAGVLVVAISAFVWATLKRGSVAQSETLSGADAVPTDPAIETMTRLARLLSRVEPDSAEAEARLADARAATEALSKQVLRVVERIEDLERQEATLSEAVDAIRTGDREKIAYLAGKVSDDGLRALLLSPHLVARDDFKAEAYVLLANERGSLEECALGYGRLVKALVSQLAQARKRIIALEQSVTMLEATSPVLVIEVGLRKSIDALNLRAEPALRWTAKQELPPGVQGYLLDSQSVS